ncbi:hypothetical protein L1987_18199 [Smallanthus sonchifolius]|uniref:Uncharacterized protein n=1 Tax=Smallanthus sonchifolius TaxID=185202 RepID=A0ACB9IYX1_9ASTR|nr:hypothetical protein L1987_18199 [Smallanthus sonchifolius]
MVLIVEGEMRSKEKCQEFNTMFSKIVGPCIRSSLKRLRFSISFCRKKYPHAPVRILILMLISFLNQFGDFPSQKT